MELRSLCVFCGSRMGARPEYETAATSLGRALAERGVTLVYGGGSVGLMGAVANAALAASGKVIGVIPEALATKEVAHFGLTDLRVVPTMHARKALMAELSDGFVALPGGVGTFEELFEIVTWAQLGIHAKPVGLLNVMGFYDGLLALMDHAVREGFVLPEHRLITMHAATPAELLAQMRAPRLPVTPRWLRPEES